MRLFLELDAGTVHLAPGTGTHVGIGSTDNLPGAVKSRIFENTYLEVFFTRNGDIIRNATPGLDLILKRNSGDNKYDAHRLNSGLTFSETSALNEEGVTEYWYTASVDFTQPIYQKLLGVDTENAREQVSFQCLANTDDVLDSTYLTIHASDGSFRYIVLYSSSTAEEASTHAPAGAVSGSILSIATNATADAVATALAGVPPSGWTGTSDGDTVTFTAQAFEAQGWHSPGTTGFEMTLVTAGSKPLTEDDVGSATMLAQFVYNNGGDQQATEVFGWELQNSLYRPDDAAAGVSPGRVRYGTVTITSGTATGTVTFSTPHSASDWAFDGAPTVEYVGGGTPDALAVATLKKTSTTGFTYYLTGTAPDGDYRLSYRTIR